MADAKCTRVSSFGSLSHFKQSQKPMSAGEAMRCLDCAVSESCPYSAKTMYIDPVRKGHTGWPISVLVEVPDVESVTDALKTGPVCSCVLSVVIDQLITNALSFFNVLRHGAIS